MPLPVVFLLFSFILPSLIHLNSSGLLFPTLGTAFGLVKTASTKPLLFGTSENKRTFTLNTSNDPVFHLSYIITGMIPWSLRAHSRAPELFFPTLDCPIDSHTKEALWISGSNNFRNPDLLAVQRVQNSLRYLNFPQARYLPDPTPYPLLVLG